MKKRNDTFPWRDGNRFILLKNGGSYFKRMLESIERAKSYIFMEMYLVESGNVATNFIDALCNAAERRVSVYLLFDGYGAHALNSPDKKRLNNAGINLVYFNPLHYWKWLKNLRRNHRKLLLVDGKVAFTGGTGITDKFLPEGQGKTAWRDNMVEIEGPVVSDWHSSFLTIWKHHSKMLIDIGPPEPDIKTSGVPGRVAAPKICRIRQEAIRSLIKNIREARHYVWIESAYFIPTWKIRRALRKSAKRGIDVRLILPGPRTDHPSVRYIGQRYYHKLLRNKIRIFEYSPTFLHSKILLCDNWVSIGSTNLDRWGHRWNLEANQEIRDEEFALKLKDTILADLAQCKEILYPDWLQRPLYRRMLESFWVTVMLRVEHFTRIRKARTHINLRKK